MILLLVECQCRDCTYRTDVQCSNDLCQSRFCASITLSFWNQLLSNSWMFLLDFAGFVKILHELWDFERLPSDIVGHTSKPFAHLTRYSTIINLGEVL